MAKFIMSMGTEALQVLSIEAQRRDVTLQQLIRAVIIPEWFKANRQTSEPQPEQAEDAPMVIPPSMNSLLREQVQLSSRHRRRRQQDNIIRPATRISKMPTNQSW